MKHSRSIIILIQFIVISMYTLPARCEKRPSDMSETLMKGGGFGGSLKSPEKEVSIFQAETNLDRAHAYPNPYKPSIHSNGITFSGLTNKCTINIFCISGELIKTLEKAYDASSDELKWDPVINSCNEEVASGIYIYIVEKEGERKTGKVAIIR